jgi:hypothetical protein
MVTGWLTWTVLLLTTQGNPDDVVYLNQRNFQIPISIKPERQADIKELLLFRSRDQGRSWEIYSRAARDKKAFDVMAQADGPLWFSIGIVDTHGRQDPPDPYRAPVGQKLVIDTTRPEVKIVSAERTGEEIQVRWEVQEAYPDWTSLKLEYWIGDSPTGQTVPLPIKPGGTGVQRFKPGIPGPVTLQLQLRDLAGNEGVDKKVVPSTPGGMVDRSVVSAGAVEGTAGMRLDSVSSRPTLTEGTNTGTSGGTPAVSGGSVGVSAPSGLTPPPPPGSAPGGLTPLPPPSGSGSGAGSSTVANAAGPPNGGMVGSGAQRMGALPPLRIVNKKQAKLEFEVAEFGPSGLGAVEVYMTTDEGATWQQTRAEPGTTLPLSGEIKNPGPVVGSVTVQLPNDGVTYGFYLVVKSRAGLGDPPPRAGDTPQVRIEVDTTPPLAELYAPTADPTRKDTLVLSWKAEDRNLASNPVSLEWAAKPEGPWEFIGDPHLPNTGRYTWVVPPRTPPKVYLRLTVRDTADNTAVAQTPDPVLIDLTKPRVSRVGVAASH